MNVSRLKSLSTKILDKNNTHLDRSNLLTETTNPKSENLDELTTNELVELFSKEDLEPQKAVANCATEITQAIDEIVIRLKKGGKLFYIGAGTSGRIGVLDASECSPTFCVPRDLVQGIIAGGYKSLYESSEELEDDNQLPIEELQHRNFNSNDCLLGISAGGTTPFVHSALTYAKTLNSLTIFISCVPYTQVSKSADVDIRLLTGPELISGSTRLKAGTATKMALNTISSSVMIKLGKVYKNQMVDVCATNLKLVDRSLRIINNLIDLGRQEAALLLEKSEGSVKVALLMYLANINIEEAKQSLAANNDNLRQALLIYEKKN